MEADEGEEKDKELWGNSTELCSVENDQKLWCNSTELCSVER